MKGEFENSGVLHPGFEPTPSVQRPGNWRRSEKARSPSALENLRSAHCIYRKPLQDSKRVHFQKPIGDPRRLFNFTNGLMGKKQISPLLDGDPNDLADQFANYLINKIKEL